MSTENDEYEHLQIGCHRTIFYVPGSDDQIGATGIMLFQVFKWIML